MNEIIELFKMRRSIYDLGRKMPLSDAKIETLVMECVKNAPSAFNSQSGRAVVLLGDQHQQLWQIVLDSLQQVTPPSKFGATQNKIASFAAAYGTILFFEDQAVVEQLQQKFPLYQNAFPLYSCQSSGMLQYMVWTALAAENIGASLQHYNPLIDDQVKHKWDLPASWQLMSQMPFGSIDKPAGEKEFLPLQDRVKIFA